MVKEVFSPTTTPAFPQYSTIFLHTYCFTIYICGAHKWIYFLVGGRALVELWLALAVWVLRLYSFDISATLKPFFIGTHNGFPGFPLAHATMIWFSSKTLFFSTRPRRQLYNVHEHDVDFIYVCLSLEHNAKWGRREDLWAAVMLVFFSSMGHDAFRPPSS